MEISDEKEKILADSCNYYPVIDWDIDSCRRRFCHSSFYLYYILESDG